MAIGCHVLGLKFIIARDSGMVSYPKSGAKVGIKKAPLKRSAKTLRIMPKLCEMAANSLRGVPKFCVYLVMRALQKSLGERLNLS